jgi:membrane-associated phospholipid phosphatase
VLLSVPSVGSHYFVDLIAGVLVGLLAIAVARRIEASSAG